MTKKNWKKEGERPRLLDLFAGAGGAARGYQLAGFHVTGIDIKPQPRYAGDWFIQGDALNPPVDLSKFDAIHASPPCQAYVRSGMVAKDGRHPALIEPVRDLLVASCLPWIIENVPGSPIRSDVILCGSMFGLSVRRHRWFESNAGLSPFTLSCDHSRPITGVYGHPHGKGGAWRNGRRPMLRSDLPTWSSAMGIDWMSAKEIALAIPPAYTEYLGRNLLTALSASTSPSGKPLESSL